jgi:hypothetical protein
MDHVAGSGFHDAMLLFKRLSCSGFRYPKETFVQSHSMVESSDIGELDIPLDHQPRTVCRDFSPPLFVAMTDENKKRCETGPRR